MAKVTQRDALIAAFALRGEPQVQGPWSKYIAFEKRFLALRDAQGNLTPIPKGLFWFVGRSGALRIGRIATSSKSATASAKDALLKDGGYYGKEG